MFDHNMSIDIRNILLAQVLLIVTVPGFALQIRRHLIRLWKIMTTPFVISRSRPVRNKFWEIDMTKFEP